jgi:hypothetical protein
MKKTIPILVLLSLWLLTSLGCILSHDPTQQPDSSISPTLTTSISSSGTSGPTASPTPVLPSPTSFAATITVTASPTTSGITSGSASGPYAVILVTAGDVLNIRSAPGSGNPRVGSFSATDTSVMQTGLSAWVGSDLWVEVKNPDGGTGWVNFAYLTEYVPPAVFCADGNVKNLISDLSIALKNSDGKALAALVSPRHGMSVRMVRPGPAILFDQAHAEWVFESTYVHDWGALGGSGLEVKGSFQDVILPKLLDVFNASYELQCNQPGLSAAFSSEPWPKELTNIGYFNVLKPATLGVDLDWSIWLVGVEYVNDQPYLFSLIHFVWEP